TASAEDARDYALDLLEMTEDQDEFDVEGIGISDTNRDWLKDNIIFPATGYSSPPESWPPPGPGWVRVVDTFQDFADTICEKFQIIVEPTGACCDPATGNCEDLTEAECLVPLQWNEGESCAQFVCDQPDCFTDGDCDDTNPCTTNACVEGTCVYTPVTDVTSCDDGLYCTDPDTCTSGVCGGPARDCSAAGDQCNVGVCDEDADACVKQPANEGQACDDGNACNT
ncbi:unnamed protein product, partial [marine sediment metagenome]